MRDTREKQVQLWKEFILDYCRTQKIFVIELEEEFPLFSNHLIESRSCISSNPNCVVLFTLKNSEKEDLPCSIVKALTKPLHLASEKTPHQISNVKKFHLGATMCLFPF